MGKEIRVPHHVDVHIRATSPLVLANGMPQCEQFPSMRDAYDPELFALALRKAQEAGISLHQGVYTAMSGPMYETDAESRMRRRLGARCCWHVDGAGGDRGLPRRLACHGLVGNCQQCSTEPHATRRGRRSQERRAHGRTQSAQRADDLGRRH